jgi:hypothetical protein
MAECLLPFSRPHGDLFGAIREVVEQIEREDRRALHVHLALHPIGLLMLTS